MGSNDERIIIPASLTIDNVLNPKYMSPRYLDDALHVEWYQRRPVAVHISIADVPRMLSKCTLPTSGVWDRRDKIFSDEVKFNELSLLQGKTQHAITFSFPISEAGYIEWPVIRRSTVHILANLPYGEAEKFLGESDHPLYPRLMSLAMVADAFWVNRHGFLNQDMWYPLIYFVPLAENIVHECMVLINYIAGVILSEHDVPALYTRYSMDAQVGVRYSVYPGRHDLLNFPVYARVSSPMILPGDLINLSNLIAFIEGKEPPFRVEEIQQVAQCLKTPGTFLLDDDRDPLEVPLKVHLAEILAAKNQTLGLSLAARPAL